MRNLKRIGTAFAALVVAASAYPAMALCSDGAWAISSFYASNGPYYSYIITPGVSGSGVNGSSVSPNLRGFFWSLGAGNAAVDNSTTGGADNGSWPAIEGGLPGGTGWMISAGEGAGAQINSTWAADTRVNGCIQTAAVNCNVVLLSDTDGTTTYFAVVSGLEDALGNYDLAQAGSAPIVLAPLPKPRITGSTRLGNDVTINVGAPMASALNAGKYLTPCGANAITGYKLYSRTVARGSGVGAGRNPSQWSPGATVPIANDTTVPVDCSDAANQDVYLAQTITLDSGYELSWVSGESTRVECGPQIAEPRPTGRPGTPSNDRVPGRGGRR